jgi:hypothetical protein
MPAPLLMAKFAHWIDVDGPNLETCSSIVEIIPALWLSISSWVMARIAAVSVCWIENTNCGDC